jgi:predicted site-specific integrase-resolvase
MQARYPKHQVFIDVASSLKYKHKGLTRLLDKFHKGVVKEVVVAHKDHLARFGVEFIDAELCRCETYLVILDQENEEPKCHELIMPVVHVFSCRLNGKRKYANATKGGKATKKRCVQGQEHSGESDVKAGFRCDHGGASDQVPVGGGVPNPPANDLVASVV